MLSALDSVSCGPGWSGSMDYCVIVLFSAQVSEWISANFIMRDCSAVVFLPCYVWGSGNAPLCVMLENKR